MTDQELLQSYVERALELRDTGRDPDLSELCSAHPEMADQVSDALGWQTGFRAWARTAATQDPWAGSLLGGRYELAVKIGSGAMGAVYRARDRELKRDVAVKLLQPHLFGEAQAVTRFTREAEVLASLRHPHVVTAHDRGLTDDGTHYLVMDLLGGASLSDVLAQVEQRVRAGTWDGGRDVAWVSAFVGGLVPEGSYLRCCARWGAELAEGLTAAHAAGIFHRDVKPSNVRITPDGRAQLLDFGIAVRHDDAALTRGDSALGTPRYMAPEQALRDVEPGPALDVYSLAAALYHLVGGRPPYEGDATQVLAALQKDAPPAIGRVNPRVPVDLRAIVECGMARVPGQRYASAAAMAADLRAFLDHQPVRARYRGPIARGWQQVRRSRWAQASALVAVAAVAAIAIPQWLDARTAHRRAAQLDVSATLPPMLTLGSMNSLEDPQARAAVGERLDRLVAIDPNDVPARARRAAFAWDRGAHGAAVEDHRVLADVLGTDYARALAERFAAAAAAEPPERPGLDGLPEPIGSGDRYLAAYQLARARQWQAAAALLGRDPDDLMARELRLLCQFASISSDDDVESVRKAAEQLEGALGQPTARTRYVAGTALLAKSLYAEARLALEEARDLAPESFKVLANLGLVYGHLGRFPAAEEALSAALRQRPGFPKALHSLSAAQARQRKFEDALATARRIPADDDENLRAHALVHVHAQWMLHSWSQDPTSAETRRHADSVLGHAETLGGGDMAPAVRFNEAAAHAIRDRLPGQLATALCGLLEDTPHNPLLLSNLAKIIPFVPPGERAALVEALGGFVDSLAQRVYDPPPPSSHDKD